MKEADWYGRSAEISLMTGDSSSGVKGVMRYQSVLGVRKGDLNCERRMFGI